MKAGDLVIIDGLTQWDIQGKVGVVIADGQHSAMVRFPDIKNARWVSAEYLEVINEPKETLESTKEKDENDYECTPYGEKK